MRKTFAVIGMMLLAVVSASAQDSHSAHNHAVEPARVSALVQDWAKQKLEKSPRHQEWVKVKHGNRTVNSFIVYPEVKSKATAVVVIHEIMGLTDWVRSVADQLAEAGYIAIAPDLLSGVGTGEGGTAAFADRAAVGQAIRDLPADQVTADLNAVADYVAKLPAANGKVAVAGFCYGGSQTFRLATNREKLAAAFVFYGSGPDNKEAIAKIKAPVYGFYGGNDARVNATIPKSQELMKEAGKKYEPVIYEGAGHGFMRAGEDPANTNEANKKARDEAWARWKDLLKKL
jgi:carboxymethylenebutenolidase